LGDVDAGLRVLELRRHLELREEIRGERAQDERAADRVVARRGVLRDRSGKGGVRAVSERHELARRPAREREGARAVRLERNELVLVTLHDEQRRADATIEAAGERTGGGRERERRTDPAVVHGG